MPRDELGEMGKTWGSSCLASICGVDGVYLYMKSSRI